MMLIKRAQKDDSIILSTITYKSKAFWGYDEAQLEKWKKELTITETYIEENATYKLIVGEKIAGYYSLLKVENEPVKLDNLFLLPEYIGKGFGKFLLLDCVNRAKHLGFKRMILDSEPNATGFYENFGFEVYNLLESSIKDRFLPQMELDLDSISDL